MTGRELIIYILENKLEDAVIPGFLTLDDFALKNDIGTATALGLIKLGVISSMKIGNEIYIPETEIRKEHLK